MSAWRTNRAAEGAVIVFAGWASTGLVHAWEHSPYDRFGWLAFLFWLAPVPWILCRRPGRVAGQGWPSWLGLTLAMIGMVGDLNALGYAGLACAVAGLLPGSARILPWLILSISWMPALGWLARTLPVPAVAGLRLVSGMVAVVLLARGGATKVVAERSP